MCVINKNPSLLQKTEIISKCHSLLDRVGEVNCENIRKLSNESRTFLRENSPVRLRELAKINCYGALKIKQALDDKYGAANYVLIAVGRSISSIAELMKHMGVDTKIIPLSGLKHLCPNDIDMPKEKYSIYKQFLNSIGLSKKEIEKNKSKTYILMDYTHIGRSLENANKFLTNDNMLGKHDNFISLPVADVLNEDYNKKGFEFLFSNSRLKDYAFVGRLPIKKLNLAFVQSTPKKAFEYQGCFTKGLRKLFWFNVFDSLINNNYADCIPNKEIFVLYERFYSKIGMQKWLDRENNKVTKLMKNL